MPKLSPEHFSSMHLYFDLLAEALNDAGFDFKLFMEKADYQYKMPFTGHLVKDQIWRPFQIYQTMSDKNPEGIVSTTEINAYTALNVYETINQRVAELTGVSVPWPNKNNMGEK